MCINILKKIIKKYSNYHLINKIRNRKILLQDKLNIQIQTNSFCNGKCRFCPYQGSWHQKNPGEMSWENYRKIIQNLKQLKIAKFCPYLENEPLLDKEIFK